MRNNCSYDRWLFIIKSIGVYPIMQLIIVLFVMVLLWSICKGILGTLKQHRYNSKLRRIGLDESDIMRGEEFEEWVAAKLTQLGYNCERTPISGDFGADLILRKRGHRYIVQIKRWNNRVTVKAVQEIVAAKKYYNADNAIVITNNYFTKSAQILAERNDVELWDRDTLMEKFR